MLSNLETEKSKLIQIVLVGQPDLRDTLDRPSLEQLRQRVTVRYHIDPLDSQETAHYINHRLARAATAAPMTFPRDVTDAIHIRSRGVPRMINVICDGILLCGYAEESHTIDMALVRMAIEELESSSVLRAPQGHGGHTRLQPVERTTHVSTPHSAVATAQHAQPSAPKPFDSALRELERRRTLGSAGGSAARAAAPSTPAVATAQRAPMQARSASSPLRATPAQVNIATVRPQPPRAAAFAVPERPASTWSRLKDALFGPGPEVERR
jgi:general secretion pathway protein A